MRCYKYLAVLDEIKPLRLHHVVCLGRPKGKTLRPSDSRCLIITARMVCLISRTCLASGSTMGGVLRFTRSTLGTRRESLGTRADRSAIAHILALPSIPECTAIVLNAVVQVGAVQPPLQEG
jgi:hypothetical protein